ncbi:MULTISPECIES: hypothetical protein [Arcticibacter]|uniref:Uncharacterized protein n=1 Tax=Arcticibacter svalbardensis MN12-7 TaxID=1150600 RepID=R9GNT7_9SPHI|nr:MULTISPECIES: hypothetical protein [Arcticibacter]EOR93170.1 hypothetical protein ADIARSV_3670 [Arcticibacter svalbardensis MN12-7]
MDRPVNFILADKYVNTKIYYVKSFEDFPLGVIRYSLSQKEYVFNPDGTYLNADIMLQISTFLKNLMDEHHLRMSL